MNNGAILYESTNHVVIATGFKRRSKNLKTGDSIQTWILNKSVDPVTAVRTKQDYSICGDCVLRGNETVGRGCYVKVGEAPRNIWRAYKKGNYEHLTTSQYESVFKDRFIRFGSYGEPVLIPFRMVESISEVAKGFTGYTHQWRNPLFSAYKRYYMASTFPTDYKEAISQGWRTFTISNTDLPDMMTCPASHEYKKLHGFKLNCTQCGQCAGLSKTGRSVQIQPHGIGKKRIREILK